MAVASQKHVYFGKVSNLTVLDQMRFWGKQKSASKQKPKSSILRHE